MIIITQYREKDAADGSTRIYTDEKHTCPHCAGRLTVRDTKRRKVIISDSSVKLYHLKRLKCKCCGRIHTQLPDCIVPHKRYAADVIETELLQAQPDCPADVSTSRRWKLIFSAILSYIPANLPAKLKTHFTKHNHWLAKLCHFFKLFSKTTPILRL